MKSHTNKSSLKELDKKVFNNFNSMSLNQFFSEINQALKDSKNERIIGVNDLKAKYFTK